MPYDNYQSFKYLALVIQSISPAILLLTVYHPPKLKKGFLEELGELLSNITVDFDSIIISGNFDVRVDDSNNPDTRQFINLFK